MKTNKEVEKALEQTLLDDAGMSVTDLRQELESQGVDAAAFLTKLRQVTRSAFQESVLKSAQESNEQLRTKSGIFGDLKLLSKEQLIEIRDKIIEGAFGSELQGFGAARCRNHQKGELSDEELRSWLEDVASTTPEK
jgi:SOS response regulatory protein OraA/RecX